MERVELGEGSVIHDSYRLKRQLGQGGMGSVWEAELLRLPKQVAIKFLIGASASHPELLARFRREAEIGSRLGHPNIVEVHDFNVLSDGTPYIVMERLRGMDLRARLAAGPLSLEEARSVVLQVASALALAHREGVVHRDLKPENIFLCEQGDGSMRVKILDFGISKIQSPNTLATRDDRILGTPGYMAPEQAMGKNSAIDGRTDLFALAAIFYEMLTGTSVFLGTTLAEVVYKVVHHTPDPLSVVTPNVPPAISSAVQQALSKDPAERQPSIQAFVAALTSDRPAPFTSQAPAADAYGGTVAVSTGDERLGPNTAAESPRSKRPSRAPTWFAAGAAGFLALALGGWALLGSPARDASRVGPGVEPDAEAVPRQGHATAELATRQERAAAEPVAATAAVIAAPTPDAAEPAPATAAVIAAPAPDATNARPAPDAATAPARPETARGATREAGDKELLPPAVHAALEQAERALRANDFAAALQLARSSLYEAKSAQAYAIMAQAYCGQRDVGMAVAMLRNLRGREQRGARAYCEKLGMTLAR